MTQVTVNGKTFHMRVVDIQRVDLIYQCYCIAEAEDGEVIEYLIGYTTLWVHVQQKNGKLPKGDPSAFKDTLKRVALERAMRALNASMRYKRITIKADGSEIVENITH